MHRQPPGTLQIKTSRCPGHALLSRLQCANMNTFLLGEKADNFHQIFLIIIIVLKSPSSAVLIDQGRNETRIGSEQTGKAG